MSVISVVSYDVKPGCNAEFIDMFREAKQVIEGLAVNLKSIRAYQWSVAGPSVGRASVVFEYGDVTDWANTVVREENDAAFNELVQRGMSPDSPAKLIARGLHTEIAPGAGNGDGSVKQLSAGRVRPGRMNDFIEQSKKMNDAVLASGAERVRYYMITVGGPNTGLVYATSDYRDMAAFGEAWKKRNSDPKWTEMVQEATGPDGPVTLESQLVLSEIGT